MSTSVIPQPRRSARLSINSNSEKTEPSDVGQQEEDIKPPPAKKQKGRPRKSVTSSSSKKATIKTEEGSSINNEGHSTIVQPTKTTNDVKPTSEELAAHPVKHPKKRARTSKVSVKVETSSSAPVDNNIKTDPDSAAGPSHSQAQASASTEIKQIIKDVKPKVETKKPAKGKAKAKVEKVVDPKKERMAKLREKCPKTILDRYKRAISQRMFMIERERHGQGNAQYEQFKVLGSTGNVYTVNIGPVPRCDCPDNLKGNKPCKHVIFVFIKVLKVPDDSSLWYQRSLTPDEIEAVFTASPPIPNGSVTVNVQVHKAYLKATGRGGEDEEVVTGIDKEVKDESEGKRMDAVGEDCPVCYEEMTQEDIDGKKLTYDETLTGCGKPLHKECFQMWAMTARNKGDDVTCVWCRSVWPDESGGQGKGKGKASGPEYTSGGYLNMAAAAGMSRERDVSTYHWGNRYRYSD